MTSPDVSFLTHRSHSAVGTGRRSVNVRLTLWAIACLLAPQPLLIKLGQSLWQREQYQFFPMMLAGAAYLAWERWDELPGGIVRQGSRAVFFLILLLGQLFLACGAMFFVRSAAGVSAILLLAALCWRMGSWRLVRAMLGPLVLLAVIVPPPGRQDQAITLRLQQWAVTLSSRWMDWLHVPNVQSGSVIEIPGRRLLVEQACSGINSLMSVLAFSLLFGLWKRRPAWRTVALLPVAAAFVLGGNVVRITAEAWLKVSWNIDVLAGTAHELLGLVLFAACVGLVVSFDAVLGAIQSAYPSNAVPSPVGATPTEPVPRFEPGVVDWVAAALCVVMAVWVQARVGRAWAAPSIRSDAVFELPDQLAGWTKVNRGAVFIERPQTEAAKSFVWNYRRGDSIASVAIDFPFTGFHELTTCYGTNGWTIGPRETVGAGDRQAVHVNMTKLANAAQGDLSFTLIDERGQSVPLPVDLRATGLAQALEITRHYGQDGPSYQVQTLLQSYVPLTQAQRGAAAEVFDAARIALTRQLLDQIGDRSTNVAVPRSSHTNPGNS